MACLKKMIDAMYDPHIYNSLTEKRLRSYYLRSPAVKTKMQKLHSILRMNKVSKANADRIVMSFVDDIIPAGAKASIRGNALNRMVATKLKTLSKARFVVKIEHCPPALKGILQERPDWVVEDRVAKHTFVGYTQTSLLGGGQQLNRASKYILNEDLHKRLKQKHASIVCLVVEKPAISKAKTKSFNIVHKGISSRRVVLPRGLLPLLRSLS